MVDRKKLWLLVLLLFLTSTAWIGCMPDEPPPPPPRPKASLTSLAEPALIEHESTKIEIQLDPKPAVGAPILIQGSSLALLNKKHSFLIIRAKISNKGTTPVRYRPPHEHTHTKDSPIPQLWGIRDDKVSPESKPEIIPRASKSGNLIIGQLIGTTELKPGSDPIEDLFAFNVSNLQDYKHFVFVMPGNLFGLPKDKVASFVFSAQDLNPHYTYDHKVNINKWIRRGSLSLKITELEEGDVNLVPINAKPGTPEYDNPSQTAEYQLLKIKFKVKNSGRKPFKYIPMTNADGIVLIAEYKDGKRLERTAIDFARIQSDNMIPRGQIPSSKRIEVKPKEVIDDYFLFDIPPENTKYLELVVLPTSFGRKIDTSGVMYFRFKYEPTRPKVQEDNATDHP